MDREKVIKALEDFNKNRICLPHLIPWDEIADAIALLKEQKKLIDVSIDITRNQDEQKRKWIMSIANNQRAIGNVYDELTDYEKGQWDGLELAYKIIAGLD